jgi:folate-binding Fe-S cluster repair protein YgfZ
VTLDGSEFIMPTAHLSERGVVRVTGEDARKFLDGLLTCDMDKVTPNQPRLGALLTPQGKILFDFILFEASEDAGRGFYLDVGKAYAPELTKRLGFYKLRAKVVTEDLSDGLAVVVGWGDAPMPDPEVGLVAPDPRLPALGWRAVVAAQDVGEFAFDDPPPTTPTASRWECRTVAAISCSTTLSRTKR